MFITNLATLPWSTLLALSVSIDLVSSSARITSVRSQKGHLGPIKKQTCKKGYEIAQVPFLPQKSAHKNT